MTVYEDLSPFEYWLGSPHGPQYVGRRPLNVGWLGPGARIGDEVDRNFVDALYRVVAAHRVNRTRGVHECCFCDRLWQFEEGGGGMARGEFLGAAEAHFRGGRGVVYAVPDLICHYVEDHGYRPPERFIKAVLRCDARMGQAGL